MGFLYVIFTLSFLAVADTKMHYKPDFSPTSWSLTLLLVFGLVLPVLSVAEDPIVTKNVEGRFHDVSRSIRSAIMGKGINIAHILPASGMLNRTGADFGYRDRVYTNAETYEFCSARISHKLARISPDNIVLCPFTISVYELASEPGIVRISYRIPAGRAGTEDVTKEIVELI
ncbi:MAG TPA: DUF302 domain-containing protein, partial [Chromatiaceae bacterium]|nr:DUF302 domain-containing protein [Chromatiaceae bacterium]